MTTSVHLRSRRNRLERRRRGCRARPPPSPGAARAAGAADVPAPYILVGHSLGGAYARRFAQLFPAEVAASSIPRPGARGLRGDCRRRPLLAQVKMGLAALPALLDVAPLLPAAVRGDVRATGRTACARRSSNTICALGARPAGGRQPEQRSAARDRCRRRSAGPADHRADRDGHRPLHGAFHAGADAARAERPEGRLLLGLRRARPPAARTGCCPTPATAPCIPTAPTRSMQAIRDLIDWSRPAR